MQILIKNYHFREICQHLNVAKKLYFLEKSY